MTGYNDIKQGLLHGVPIKGQDIVMNNIPLPTVVNQIHPQPPTTEERFWSTVPRAIIDKTNDVIEIQFAGIRLVNTISFLTAHFPHTVWAEYRDEVTQIWLPFLSSGISDSSGIPLGFQAPTQPAQAVGESVKYATYDSVPAVVNTSDSAYQITHNQHFGPGHWMPVSWRVKPVNCRRVRLRLQRNITGRAPQSPGGDYVPYSLGIKDLQVGYRVNTKDDVPRTTGDFSSSDDLFGSRVSYSMHQQFASSVLDSDPNTAWRSNPQPINYAVVNLHVDTRDSTGAGQVIDRFYMDPTTLGVHTNLYYSNDMPLTHYAASEEPIVSPIAQQFGAALVVNRFGTTSVPDSIFFSKTAPSFIDIDNAFLQFDPSQPWWFALEQIAQVARDGGIGGATTIHPWFTFGGHQLRQNGSAIEFVSSTGQVTSISLDATHTLGSIFSVAVVYNPVDTGDMLRGITLFYRLQGSPLRLAGNTAAMDTSRPTTVSIGRDPVFGVPGIPAMGVRGLVMKDRAATVQDIDWFTRDGAGYVVKDPFIANDNYSTANSLFRMSPLYSGPSNLPGLVGGTGNVYRDMTWIPIPRDYTTKKGYLRLPPTKAKFFKFEFTNLAPENFESFVPIRRQIKVFSNDTVSRYEALTANKANPDQSDTVGLQSMLDLSESHRYLDALNILRTSSQTNDYSPTEVLFVKDPVQQQQARALGWIWNFQPWHLGLGAPRFIDTQKHIYEAITVDHRTKIGYFVGLRTLQAYRVDYTVADDTPEYVEHFFDSKHILSMNGVDWNERGVRSFGAFSEVKSTVFNSHRPVRALQFATSQTESYALLPDDGFVNPTISLHWNRYGDASIVRMSNAEVIVNRGWKPRLYQQLEISPWSTYGGTEGHLYGELEGGTTTGSSAGGIISETVTPSNSGRVYAAARVTSSVTLTAPVILEIIGAGGVVLASTTRSVQAGETVDIWIGYTIGSASVFKTYGNIQTTYANYGAMQAVANYGALETTPISGGIYARLSQQVATQDTFVVKRLSLFDAPISWQFSVDGGTTYYDAVDARNDVNGVLSFPQAGTQLQWRLLMFRADSAVTSLAIRPWYTGFASSVTGNSSLQPNGPTQSVVDSYPDIEGDPMWQQTSGHIPSWWYRSNPNGSLADAFPTSGISDVVWTPTSFPNTNVYPATTEFPA